MTTNSRAVRLSINALLLLLASVSVAYGSITFFAYGNLPFPYAARHLVSPGPAVSLEPHQVLIEGYALNKRGRPVQSVAVYPGAFDRIPEEIPGSLAVTDANGFFSIIVDRDQNTHLAAGCLALGKRGEQPGPVVALGLVVLPKADVSQAERTFRLKMPRRTLRCAHPIEGPPPGTFLVH